METTIHMTAANFLSKAMALPPPPPVPQLARKRSWNEMTHAPLKPTLSTPALHIPAPLASFYAKKTKRTLASDPLSIEEDADVRCLGCDGRIGDSIDSIAISSLSADAQKFLAEDPFDFDALPHPVLTRQRAVQDVREHTYGMMNDDDMDGEELSFAPSALKALPSRWNASVVGASLGRATSSAFQPRRM